MSKLRPICLGLVPLLWPAARSQVAQAQLADLHKRLDVEQRRTAAAEHKLDELENRVFLLTDQVESQKVAAIHRARQPLPIVTLKPEGATPTPRAIEVRRATASTAAKRSCSRARPSRAIRRAPGRCCASTARAWSRARAPAPRSSRARAARVPLAGEKPRRRAGAADPRRGPAEPPSEHAAPAAEPLALYKTAYDDLRAGRHEAAERGFREFVRSYPHHDYADNAQYWLGECFYDQRALRPGGAGVPRRAHALADGQQGARRHAQARLQRCVALGDVDKGAQDAARGDGQLSAHRSCAPGHRAAGAAWRRRIHRTEDPK